eukprot:TRINITY_DN107525_c0_g1_i1.p1 TRINITY_DN107525_c0_g1~~TRINITY_DN107525_c0_g1_i1.p1  ORF type:complete len:439 (-),score=86.97 TRINITY_DN107525_c0_g1_i1:132-1283(-)
MVKKAEDFDEIAAIYKTALQHVFNDIALGVYEIGGADTEIPAVKSPEKVAAFINSKMDEFLQEARAEAGSGPITMALDQLGVPMEWDKSKYTELLHQKAQELAKAKSEGKLKPGDTLLKRVESLKTIVLMFPSAMGILGQRKVALMTPYRGWFNKGNRFPLPTVEDDEFRDEPHALTVSATPVQFMVLFEIKKGMLAIDPSLDIRVLPHPVVDDYEWNTHLGKENPAKSLLETVSWKTCAEVPWSALYGNTNWANFIFVGTYLKFDGSRPWSHRAELIEQTIDGKQIKEVQQALKPGVPRLCRWKPCTLCAARMVHELGDIVFSENNELQHAKNKINEAKTLRRSETAKHEADWMEHSLDAFRKASEIYRESGFFMRMKKIVE